MPGYFEREDDDKKGPDLGDKEGPDDFLKYFISITAERKQSRTRVASVRASCSNVQRKSGINSAGHAAALNVATVYSTEPQFTQWRY